jgi:hypothetical protein
MLELFEDNDVLLYACIGGAAYYLFSKRGPDMSEAKSGSFSGGKPEEVPPVKPIPPAGSKETDPATYWDNSVPLIDYGKLARAIAQRESGGKYNIKNTLGYIGKYQAGLPALETIGYAKAGLCKEYGYGANYVLKDAANWTSLGGGSMENYLSSPQLQEKSMVLITRSNYRILKSKGVLDSNSTRDEIAGYLSAAHGLGWTGAKALKNNKVTKDGYGYDSARAYKSGVDSQYA